MTRRSSGTGQAVGRWVSRLVLAYALLLQVMVGGMAATEHLVGVATGVICQGHTEDSTDGGEADHTALCCAFGCLAAAAPAALDPPAPVALAFPEPQRLAAAIPPSERAAAPVRHLSFAARGPPARG